MARVTVTGLGGSRNSPATAITRIIVPRDNALTARKSYTNSADAIFARQSHDQLTAVRDAEAMQKLADGHTEAFIAYARNRIPLGKDANEKAYWQGLADRATSKLEDDTLAAGVKNGTATLEQLRDHLQARADALGPAHPDYASYVGEIGKVRDSIKARDFNAGLLKAQNDYYASGDKSAYKKSLLGYLQQTTDPTIHSKLSSQIDTLQKSIETDEVTKRVGQATQQITAAYQGDKKPHEVIAFLNQQAAGAKTTQEAQWYANEATKLAAYDRQQTRDALASAASSGSVGAVKSAIADSKSAYKEASTAATIALKDRTPLTDDQRSQFLAAAQQHIDDINATLPNANAKGAATLLAEREAVQKDIATIRARNGAAAVNAAKDAATEFAAVAKTYASATEKGDYANVSSIRYEWAQALAKAMQNPDLTTDQKRNIQNDITNGPLQEQAKDIQKELTYLKTDPTTGESVNRPPSKVSTTGVQTAYNTYEKKFADVYDGVADKPAQKSMDDWLQAMLPANKRETDVDSTGNPLPAPGDEKALRQYLFGARAGNASSYGGGDVKALEEATNRIDAARQKENDTFAQRQDQAIAAIVQLTKSHQPDLRDDQNLAASATTFKPDEYGPFAPTLLGPSAFGVSGSDKAMGGYYPPGQQAEQAPSADGATTAFASGYDPTYGDQASAMSNADITAFDSGSAASDQARMDAHMRGHGYLESATPLELPGYDIPELPPASPFADGYSATAGDQASAMPPAPDVAMPPPPSEAIAFPDAPVIA